MNPEAQKFIQDANRMIGEEVERRAREWLELAKGTDFTAILESTIKERDALFTRAREMEILLSRIRWLYWRYSNDEEPENCYKCTCDFCHHIGSEIVDIKNLGIEADPQT